MSKKPETPGLDRVIERFRSLASVELAVGVHSDAEPHPDSAASMALIASVHEFGSPDLGIPERAPIRKTIAARREEYISTMQRIGRAVTKGTPVEAALNIFGQKVASDIQSTIEDGLKPALAESTVKGRQRRLAGNDGEARNDVFTDTESWLPLIDTGRLRASYRHELRKRRKEGA